MLAVRFRQIIHLLEIQYMGCNLTHDNYRPQYIV
nr:MAG TPA: hypothetical protein [Bacteriophage sp.]